MNTTGHQLSEILKYLDKYFFALFVALLAYIVLKNVFRKHS